MYTDIPESVDYPGGELVIYPGASHSTDQLLKKCDELDRCGPPISGISSQMNQQLYKEQKRKTIGRMCQFFEELAKKNRFDFILFDLDPSTNTLNKWLIAYIADMLLSPAQAGISSTFAVNNQLLHHLPAWRTEVESLGVPTRYAESLAEGGKRTRLGALPRVLPMIVTDFDLEAPRPPAAAAPMANRHMVPAHANHVASMDLLFTNSWVPLPARPGQQALPLDVEKKRKAASLQALYLPDGAGRMVIPLWPRVQALGQAHEMGRALSALDKESYERFYVAGGRGLNWEAVQEEVELTKQRFRSYAEIVLAYTSLMIGGQPIGQLFRL